MSNYEFTQYYPDKILYGTHLFELKNKNINLVLYYTHTVILDMCNQHYVNIDDIMAICKKYCKLKHYLIIEQKIFDILLNGTNR